MFKSSFSKKVYKLASLLVIFVGHTEATSIENKLEKRVLRLGFSPLPPHIYESENGELSGPLVKFINDYISPQVGVEIELINLPLPRIFKQLDENSIDGMAFAGESSERRKNYIYPENHITETSPILALKTNKSRRISHIPSDITKLKIGYLGGGIVTSYIHSKNIDLSNLYGKNMWQRNLERLMIGRVDAVYSPSLLSMEYLLAKEKTTKEIRLIELPEETLKWFIVFSKSKLNTERQLAKSFDKAMEKIEGRRVYTALLKEYLEANVATDAPTQLSD